MRSKNLFWVLFMLGAVTVLALIGLYLLQTNLPAPPPDLEFNLTGLIMAGREGSWSPLRLGEFGPVILRNDGSYQTALKESGWRVTSAGGFDPVLVGEESTVLLRFSEGRWEGKVLRERSD